MGGIHTYTYGVRIIIIILLLLRFLFFIFILVIKKKLSYGKKIYIQSHTHRTSIRKIAHNLLHYKMPTKI